MNTYRIYEDLRSSLGDEAAKSLAHTLGPMFEELGNTVTKSEFRELTATVGRLADAQERTEIQVTELTKAQARTEAQVAALTQAQARTEAQVAALTQAQERTEAQMAELVQAQAHTEAQVSELTKAQAELTKVQAHADAQLVELTAAQARTEARLASLTDVVQSLAINLDRQTARLDSVLGWTFEMQFRDRLPSYLGRLMRRARLLRNDEVRDAIEQVVAPHEADEMLRVDAIAAGVIDGVATHVVVEVSAACGAADIDRAERRAAILRKAGLVAVPLVACQVITPELRGYAHDRQVRIWCDGTILDAAA